MTDIEVTPNTADFSVRFSSVSNAPPPTRLQVKITNGGSVDTKYFDVGKYFEKRIYLYLMKWCIIIGGGVNWLTDISQKMIIGCEFSNQLTTICGQINKED